MEEPNYEITDSDFKIHCLSNSSFDYLRLWLFNTYPIDKIFQGVQLQFLKINEHIRYNR